MKKHQSVFYKITACSLILIVAGVGLYFTKNYIFKEKAVFSASDFGDSIDIFSNYTSWKKSSSKKTGDTMSQTLYVLGRSIVKQGDGDMDHSSVTPQSTIDINGDGLVDIVYHYRYKHQGYPSDHDRLYSAVLLNKGSLSYELSYKCVYDYTAVTPPAVWYGDCAE